MKVDHSFKVREVQLMRPSQNWTTLRGLEWSGMGIFREIGPRLEVPAGPGCAASLKLDHVLAARVVRDSHFPRNWTTLRGFWWSGMGIFHEIGP